VTFAVLAMAAAGHEPTSLDVAVRSAVVRAAPSAWLHAVFSALSFLGSVLVLGPVACLAVFGLWRRGTSNSAAQAGLLSLASVILTWALKACFHRTRPPGALMDPGLGFSFPSGHSLQTMAIAVTVAYVSYREGLIPRWAVHAGVLFSVLVGMSRVYLDVHWATDVLAGWCGGAVVAGGSAWLYETSSGARDMSREATR
jgi:membrane-associated phospholipid phosphatase